MRMWAMTLACLALAGCGGGDKGGEADKPGVEPVAEVTAAIAMPGAGEAAITGFGTIEATPGTEHAIIAPFETVVARIIAPIGTPVRAGAPVVALHPSLGTDAAISKTAIDVRQASAALARAERLRADQLATDADVEAARAALATAQNTMLSGIHRGNIVLHAPASGIVQSFAPHVGDLTPTGTTIAVIATGGAARARIGVDPAIAARLPIGMAVEIARADGSLIARAPISGIDRSVDAATRLATLFVALPGGSGAVPGEPVRATIREAATTTAITIPYAALIDEDGRSYVYTVRGGTAHRIAVVPGSSSADRIAINGGLSAGDRVVTEGATALADGMKVRVRGAGAR